MAEDKLRILIEAVDSASKTLSGVQAELARVEGSAATASAGLKDLGAAGSGASPQLLSIASSLGLITTAAGLVTSALGFLRSGFHEMAGDIRAATQIQQAFNAAGLQGSASAIELASGLQSLTGIQDDAIVSGQALLVTIGRLSGDGFVRATKAALDLSVAMGIDVHTAFLLIAKAAAGSTGALARYGLILDESVKEGEKLEALLSLIEQRMGGQAEAFGKTAPGAFSRFTAAVRESFGATADLAANNSIITGGLGLLQAAFEANAKTIKNVTDNLDTMAVMAGKAAPALERVAAALPGGLPDVVPLVNEVERSFKALGLTTLPQVYLKVAQVENAFRDLQAAFDAGDVGERAFEALRAELVKLAQELKSFGISSNIINALAAIGAKASSAGEGIKIFSSAFEKAVRTGTGFSEMLSDQAEALRQMASAAADLATGTSEELPGMFGTGFSAILPDQMQDLIDLSQELTDMQEIGRDAAAGLGASLVEAAIMGELAFKDLGQAVRRFIAQLAAAVVQALILRAIMAAITGGSSAVAPSTAGTGTSFIGPEGLTAPSPVTVEQFRSLAPQSQPAVISNSFLGVSRAFVEELTEVQNDLARRHGVQILASGLVS